MATILVHWMKYMPLLPEAEFSISTREARLLAGDMSLDPSEHGPTKRSWITTTTRRRDCSAKVIASVRLEVVASTRHTPGHIAFLDTRDRTLIAGDAYQTE